MLTARIKISKIWEEQRGRESSIYFSAPELYLPAELLSVFFFVLVFFFFLPSMVVSRIWTSVHGAQGRRKCPKRVFHKTSEAQSSLQAAYDL